MYIQQAETGGYGVRCPRFTVQIHRYRERERGERKKNRGSDPCGLGAGEQRNVDRHGKERREEGDVFCGACTGHWGGGGSARQTHIISYVVLFAEPRERVVREHSRERVRVVQIKVERGAPAPARATSRRVVRAPEQAVRLEREALRLEPIPPIRAPGVVLPVRIPATRAGAVGERLVCREERERCAARGARGRCGGEHAVYGRGAERVRVCTVRAEGEVVRERPCKPRARVVACAGGSRGDIEETARGGVVGRRVCKLKREELGLSSALALAEAEDGGVPSAAAVVVGAGGASSGSGPAV